MVSKTPELRMPGVFVRKVMLLGKMNVLSWRKDRLLLLIFVQPHIFLFLEVLFFDLLPFLQFFSLVPLIPGGGFGVRAVGVAACIRVDFYLCGAAIPLVKEYAIEIVTTNSRHNLPPALGLGSAWSNTRHVRSEKIKSVAASGINNLIIIEKPDFYLRA
jgi:hypothetical protein